MIPLLLLLLFSSSLLCCDKPCRPHEVCYPGVGCIALQGHVKATAVTINCFSVTINTVLTPTLFCDSASGNVIDTNRCRDPPILSNPDGVAQQGGVLDCGGLPCDPNIGCFGTPPGTPILINCCGVCIDPLATPTIHCSSFTDCSGATPPQIVDTNQCRSSPVIPATGSNCVTQGDLIQCPFGQTCLSETGCVAPVTGAPVLLTQPSNGSNDRINLIVFFIGFILLFIVVVIILALIVFFK